LRSTRPSVAAATASAAASAASADGFCDDFDNYDVSAPLLAFSGSKRHPIDIIDDEAFDDQHALSKVCSFLTFSNPV
jgi:hypothetical protein